MGDSSAGSGRCGSAAADRAANSTGESSPPAKLTPGGRGPRVSDPASNSGKLNSTVTVTEPVMSS